MGFRCGCPPTQKSQAHDENTHTHAHKLKGCCHRPCQYFLCVSVSLPIPVFTSLHLSMSHSVSTSASLRVSLSLWLHVCRLSPSLFLHLSVSRSVPQSLLVFLFLSLSLCLSLSFRPPPRGSSCVNESLGTPHRACDLSRAGPVETRRLHPSDGEPAGSEGCPQSWRNDF